MASPTLSAWTPPPSIASPCPGIWFPYPGGDLPGGQRCPNTGSGCGWRRGWQVRGGREADPGDGQRARRRGRCCRQPLGGQEPQQLACAPPGAGCSAAAGDSAGGWHGRRPVGHPAWGARGGVRRVYWGHSSPLSTSSPDLFPRIMTTQWPFVNGKEPYICVASLLLHERKQRREGNFSRISSQEM